MAKYFVSTNDGKRKYIKTIDLAKGTLTFTENSAEAYVGRDGYYATPFKEQIQRGFAEDYPEVANLHVTQDY